MKISFKYTGRIISLPAEITEFTSQATKDDMTVIINLFANPEYLSSFDSCLEAFSEKTGLGVDTVLRSLSFWSKTGIIEAEGIAESAPMVATTERVPSYSGAQINKFISENKRIASLFDACQQIMGKSFSPIDFNNVIYLKDYFKFSDDYIMLLIAHCVENEKSGWAYIRKTAKNLYEEGIDTYSELERHFADRKNRASLEYKIRSAFGIGARELSKREREKFDLWISADISEELVKKAYDITVNNTSKPSVAYASKIIENWISLGYKTLEEIEASEDSRRAKMSASTFETDDFFEAALERSKNYYSKEAKK